MPSVYMSQAAIAVKIDVEPSLLNNLQLFLMHMLLVYTT